MITTLRPLLAPAATALVLAGTTLAGSALPALAQDSQPAPLTEAERTQFRAEVRDYLMEHPEVLLEAIQALESRQQEQAALAEVDMIRQNADAIFDDGFSWVGGNPEGDVTVVEFMDYRCGYCRRAFEEVEELVASDGNIRFVLKEFPILGEESVVASRLAIATQITAGDDAYKAVHDALMAYSGGYDEVSMSRLLGSLQIEPAPVLAAMNSAEVNDVINANRALAQTLQITGTPTFVMGDTMLRGYVPLPGMRSIVADMRQQ